MQLIIEYVWVLIVLIGLEGLLAADNALVLAVMVKHLPEKKRKRALFYGLLGSFILRFSALFIISFLVDIWQIHALGAIYLLYISLNYLLGKWFNRDQSKQKNPKKESGFWLTVLKV